MSRALHHRKKDNQYNVWSTIIDDYVYDWDDKDFIERQWLTDMILDDMSKIKEYMKHISKEV